MRGWQFVLLILGLLRGSAHAHCICHDEDHGSFSLEFSEEVSLSRDLSDLPFTIHHHDHSDEHHHHHHDHSPDFFSSELFDSDEHHGSFHEEFSAELELDVDDHDHSHHDHSYSHEHHHHDHDYDYDYSHEIDFSPETDDLLFYYRK